MEGLGRGSVNELNCPKARCEFEQVALRIYLG